MNFIEGGVCAAKGFTAGGIHCGIRKNKTKRAFALIFSEKKASAAAVYTTNLVKGAPLAVTKMHLMNGTAQAVICNSGNANTCNADGIEVAQKMSKLASDALGIDDDDVVVASTGVIGQPLDVTPIANSINDHKASLGNNSKEAAEGISAQLIKLGVKAFWNFSHYDIAMHHPGVVVQNIHFSDSLMRLSFKMED